MSPWKKAVRSLIRVVGARRHAFTLGGVLIVATALLATSLNPFVDPSATVVDAGSQDAPPISSSNTTRSTRSLSVSPSTSPARSPAPPPGRCLPEDLVAHARSREEVYRWWSGDDGDAPPEHVQIDIHVVNEGPDCIWFESVGQVYDNIEPAPGEYEPHRYDQCVWFLLQEPRTLRRGQTLRWTYSWDQRCGHPGSNYRGRVAPGKIRFGLYACTHGCRCDAATEATIPGCWAATWDAILTTATFRLEDRASSPSPVPSLGAGVSPTPLPRTTIHR